jgi:signal transduction histidine kinase
MVLTKTHKWLHEIKRRHLLILFLDFGLILTILAFTSYVILNEIIVRDLRTDVESMVKMVGKGDLLESCIKVNESRYIAAFEGAELHISPGFHLLGPMRRKMLDPDRYGGSGLALINGYPKVYVLIKGEGYAIMAARKAPQTWFYLFIFFLMIFLFLFFHIQRFVGYRFLFSPAMSKVAFYEQLNEAKETFFAGIFHELGTPLTSLMSRLELLMESNTNPLQAESLEYAYLEAQRINFLSTEQLHRARFEMGVVKMNVESIYPGDLMDAMFFRLEILLKHHGKNLVITCGEHERSFRGDRLKLEQALINLITNAIKYAPEGHEIRLGVLQSDEETVFEVRDEGRGIKPEVIATFMEPFSMGEQTHQTLSSTGLGLYLVNQIAILHGGRLSFHQHHLGFTVKMHIPEVNSADLV